MDDAALTRGGLVKGDDERDFIIMAVSFHFDGIAMIEGARSVS